MDEKNMPMQRDYSHLTDEEKTARARAMAAAEETYYLAYSFDGGKQIYSGFVSRDAAYSYLATLARDILAASEIDIPDDDAEVIDLCEEECELAWLITNEIIDHRAAKEAESQ
jgi:hypothetical protein